MDSIPHYPSSFEEQVIWYKLYVITMLIHIFDIYEFNCELNLSYRTSQNIIYLNTIRANMKNTLEQLDNYQLEIVSIVHEEEIKNPAITSELLIRMLHIIREYIKPHMIAIKSIYDEINSKYMEKLPRLPCSAGIDLFVPAEGQEEFCIDPPSPKRRRVESQE